MKKSEEWYNHNWSHEKKGVESKEVELMREHCFLLRYLPRYGRVRERCVLYSCVCMCMCACVCKIRVNVSMRMGYGVRANRGRS